MKGVYCGCHESYPQMRDRFVSHAPGCPLRVALEERDALRARAEAAEAKADRLAKLLGEARKGLEAGGNAAFVTSMWVESGDDAGDGSGWREVERRIRVTIAAIDAALAEKEVGDGNG